MATTLTRRALLSLSTSLVLLCHTSLAETFFDPEADQSSLALKDDEENSPLHEAIRLGQDDAALKLIAEGADVNSPNGSGQTPLMLACFRGSEPLVKALIAAKCEVNTVGDQETSALLYACPHFQSKPQLVISLLEAGASPLLVENHYHSSSALRLALEQKDDELFNLLLSKVNREDDKLAETLSAPLQQACHRGDLDLVKKLAAAGASLQYDGFGDAITPLLHAIDGKQAAVVQYLLEQKTLDLSIGEHVERVANCFGREMNSSILKLLLDYGLDANSRNSSGVPLLHLMIQIKNAPLVKMLLEHGADPKIKDLQGRDALIMAQIYLSRNREILRLLNPEGKDISIKAERATQMLDILINQSGDRFIISPERYADDGTPLSYKSELPILGR